MEQREERKEMIDVLHSGQCSHCVDERVIETVVDKLLCIEEGNGDRR